MSHDRGMYFCAAIGPHFAEALTAVVGALAGRHPTASIDQLREMVVVRGIVGWVDDLHLPRPEELDRQG